LATKTPTGVLRERFSTEGAHALPWTDAEEVLSQAEVYWVSTVRPDGHPHTTPLIAVLIDDCLYFTTGPAERKAKNIASNAHCLLTTGCNKFYEGLDVVVEGDAVRLLDDAKLRQVAHAFREKYGPNWSFDVTPGMEFIRAGDDAALVFEIKPVRAFGFGKGEPFSQTTWFFEDSRRL
jgi:nitroimidazol reductase NimA-like FMN-containing flavoprotein (pyridoxamine 5'-phosphate oxidase superfamily)